MVLALAALLLLIALVVALAALLYRRRLRRWLRDELVWLAGPAIVRALPPKQVMTTLMDKIYGDHDVTEVVVGVLGGAGVEPLGADLRISSRTTVDIELRRVDWTTYELKLEVTHLFREGIADHRFAIIATCDPQLRDSIALACRLPMYEEWFVPNPDFFEKSVDEIASSARIGIHYVDRDGNHHLIPPTKVVLHEVSMSEWRDFLLFFSEPLGNMPKRSPRLYMRSLRIFEFDLGELANDDDVMASIRAISLTSTSLQPLAEPFCYWQAPYPCYVERMRFDASELRWDGEPEWLFRVVPFTFRSAVASGQWSPAHELGDLFVGSWLLPGHGVALMWKPDDT